MLLEIGPHKMEINPEEQDIEAIILFGSHAYGQADDQSDVDLLIVLDGPPPSQLESRRKDISSILDLPPDSIEIFSTETFRMTAKKGGLLLNSIKAYGITLYSHTDFVDGIFANMPITYNSKSLFTNNRRIVRSLMMDYRKGKVDSFDVISDLAFSIRELCMGICYQHQLIEIRRYEPVEKCYDFEDIDVPFGFEEYKELYGIKRQITSDATEIILPTIKKSYIKYWYKKYKILVKQVFK